MKWRSLHYVSFIFPGRDGLGWLGSRHFTSGHQTFLKIRYVKINVHLQSARVSFRMWQFSEPKTLQSRLWYVSSLLLLEWNSLFYRAPSNWKSQIISAQEYKVVMWHGTNPSTLRAQCYTVLDWQCQPACAKSNAVYWRLAPP